MSKSLRAARSVSRLSSLFSNPIKAITRRQDPSNHSLIYVLLAPGVLKEEDPSIVTLLVSKVAVSDGIESVILLENIRPSSAFNFAQSNLTSKLAANTILIGVNTQALPQVIRQVQRIFQTHDFMLDRNDRQIFFWNMTIYTQVQAFQPAISQGLPGTCIVTVSIIPAPGQEADVDEWYRKQHLKLLSGTSPDLFLRSNRYIQTHDPNDEDSAGEHGALDNLAVHGFTSVKALFQNSIENGPIVEETEWGKRVLEGKNEVRRTVWEVRAVK